MSLAAYLPRDRYAALLRAEDLPQYTRGAALFADLSGFTPFTDTLVQLFGPRRGAEECSRHLNRLYEGLIARVHAYRGSVVAFSGDAITCWFAAEDASDDGVATHRAVACALLLLPTMHAVGSLSLPDGGALTLGLKVAVTSGPARRFLVGDRAIRVLDALTGATITRLATAEQLAAAGEVLIDVMTATTLGTGARIGAWRAVTPGGERFAVVSGLDVPVRTQPWPDAPALPDEMLRPWLLPAVYARHQAGLGEFLTELRPAVPLFLRFAGIAYEEDPDAGAKLDTFIRGVQGVLARYEGALLQLTFGDKGSYLLAVFGAPVAHEDDAQRAVSAVAALQALAIDLPDLQPLQIGISRGVVWAGAYGSTTCRIYGVQGDEVNLAARLMQRAAPGEVLLSGPVQQALGAEVALEPLPPIALKGLPEPLPVFRLVGQRGRAVRLTEPTYALPMVGRAAQQALIAERLARAIGGQGQVVGITAEAGMGKSRLLAEVIRLARHRELRAFGGACQSYGTSTPYLVWGPIWRGFFALDPEAPPRRQLRALEGEVAELAPERLDALPLLGPLVGLAIPDNETTRGLEPQYRKLALEALLVDCLRAAALEARREGSGLLFVLEDLHWVDAASHDLLERIAQESATLPVLTVLCYRPPETLRLQSPRVEALPHFTRIALPPLAANEAEQVIRATLAQLLPGRRGLVTPDLVARITAHAEGNPFYVEELLRYIHDRGIDPRDTATLAALELPTSLYGLILSRIDQLGEQQRTTLKVASVIGRLFRVAWLHGYYPALGTTERLKADLEELRQLDLTPLDTPEPELTYLFKHVVTQEVAYESLAAATRALLHEQLAVYLETLAGGDTLAYLDLLAYHYAHSENRAKAWAYLRRAGEAAAARYANAVAVDYFTRALALTPPAEDAERYALQREREEVYDLQGERVAQREDLAALTALAAALGDPTRQSEVALRWSVYWEGLGDSPAATTAAAQAVAVARDAGLAVAEAAAQFQLGWVLWRQQRLAEAQAPLERSLALARALGDHWLECRSLGSLGVVAVFQDDFTRARSLCLHSIAVARASGNRVEEGRTLQFLGVFSSLRGDYATARSYLDASLTISRSVGWRRLEVYVLISLGTVARCGGDYPRARALYEQGLTIARAVGDRHEEGVGLWGLGAVALDAGRLQEAAASYEAALAVQREVNLPAGGQEAVAGLAQVALARGDLVGAQAHAEAILAYLAAGGRLDNAEEPLRVELVCYQVLQATGDPRAAVMLEEAYGRLQERAARIEDADLRRMFLEQVPHHRELQAAWAALQPHESATLQAADSS